MIRERSDYCYADIFSKYVLLPVPNLGQPACQDSTGGAPLPTWLLMLRPYKIASPADSSRRMYMVPDKKGRTQLRKRSTKWIEAVRYFLQIYAKAALPVCAMATPKTNVRRAEKHASRLRCARAKLESEIPSTAAAANDNDGAYSKRVRYQQTIRSICR